MTKPKSQTESPAPSPRGTPRPETGLHAPGPRVTPAFLDGLEDGMARLLMQDEHGEWRTFHLPAAALPQEAHEGTWIELSIRSIPPPPEHAGRALRDKLGRNDRGGDFAL